VQGHPLDRISHYAREFDWVPPRCLIPRFPDDPKSRFRDELDEETTGSRVFRTTGSWKTVKTLEMFWEMMAFRQECSSGRMTGFVWLVFNGDDEKKETATHPDSQTAVLLRTPKANRTINMNVTPTTTPRKLFTKKAAESSAPSEPAADTTAKSKSKNKPKKKKKRSERKKWPSGPIKPRTPKVKTAQRNYLLDQAESSAYYSWTPAGRGERICSEADYKRIGELLLHLDFSTLDKAAGSTNRWLGEIGMGADWGYSITGTREVVLDMKRNEVGAGATKVNNLTGLVKRKRNVSPSNGDGVANVLSDRWVRKKPKAEKQVQESTA
jgi:regulator of Ty1 transposition protein 109